MNIKDLKILYELDMNSRLSATQLSKKIKIPKGYISRKILEFKRTGLIKDFVSLINYSRLGYDYFRLNLYFKNISPEKEEQLIYWLRLKKNVLFIERFGEGITYSLLLIFENYETKDFMNKIYDDYGAYLDKLDLFKINKFVEYPRAYLINKAVNDLKIEFSLIDSDRKERERYKLEDKDLSIINLLSNNARISLAEINKRIGVPERTINYRIKNLQKLGVIEGYRTNFDYHLLNLNEFKLEVEVSTSKDLDKIITFGKNHPNIIRIEQEIGHIVIFTIEVNSFNSLMLLIDLIKEQFKIRSFKVNYIREKLKFTYFS